MSMIEPGETSRTDIIAAYAAALGGGIELTASLGDRKWTMVTLATLEP